MERIKEYGNRKKYGHVLLSSVVGCLCLFYLSTTGTTEDQRLVDALARYWYAHYTVIERPTQKNEQRLARYEARLARLSHGKFNHLDEEEVKAFLRPRGYAYEMEEGEGEVDYLLASFTENGRFEAEVPGSLSYDYFLLDRIYVYPYEHFQPDYSVRKRDWSPFVFYAKDGLLYIDGRYKAVFKELFSRFGKFETTVDSKTATPGCYEILYRGVKDIWRDARLLYRTEKASEEYFIENSFESSIPAVLGCVARESYYRKRKGVGTNGLELAYLKSLAEDPSFITLGLLCYLGEKGRVPWAKDVIRALETQGLDEFGLENCTLGELRRAARRALERKSGD
jgi:hypothetical protein